MIFLIIGAILGFIIFTRGIIYDVAEGLIGALMGLMVGALVCLIATIFWGPYAPMETVFREYELVQMNDHVYSDTEGHIGGSIFVISGKINTELSSGFSYYQKDGDGYSLKTVDASKSMIKYSDNKPKVVVDDVHCVKPKEFFSFWFMNIKCKDEDQMHYTFYIPQGSVKENFSLGGGQ